VAEEYTPLDFQISDAELEQLPPLALRLIIRKLLDHIPGQDQRIRELETEISQLKARLNQNSSNSNKPPSPYQENTPKPARKKSGGRKGHKGHRQQLINPTRTELIHPGP
jgi:transposase